MRALTLNNTREIEISESGVICFCAYTSSRGHRIQRRETTGSVNGEGYLRVEVAGKSHLVHRLVARAYLANYSEDLHVDHIDGNKANNNVSNLRMVTQAENNRAYKKPTGSVQYRGVFINKGNKTNPYVAQITVNGKNKHIGYFPTEEAAVHARDVASIKYGFPPEALNFR